MFRYLVVWAPARRSPSPPSHHPPPPLTSTHTPSLAPFSGWSGLLVPGMESDDCIRMRYCFSLHRHQVHRHQKSVRSSSGAHQPFMLIGVHRHAARSLYSRTLLKEEKTHVRGHAFNQAEVLPLSGSIRSCPSDPSVLRGTLHLIFCGRARCPPWAPSEPKDSISGGLFKNLSQLIVASQA